MQILHARSIVPAVHWAVSWGITSYKGTLLDGSPSAQDHVPDAIQFVGLGLPEEMNVNGGRATLSC